MALWIGTVTSVGSAAPGNANASNTAVHGKDSRPRPQAIPTDNLTVAVPTNLDETHSNPTLIAHVVAGLVTSALLPTLIAIPDNDPAIAGNLRTMLDEIAAGTAPRLQLTTDFGAMLDSPRAPGRKETKAGSDAAWK